MNNRKIVFFDIDGTIYRFDTGMPKDTYEAIKLLKAKGHIPVICTGRTRCMIYKEHMAPGFRDIVAGAGTLQPVIKSSALVKKYTNDAEKKLAFESEYLDNLDLLTKE